MDKPRTHPDARVIMVVEDDPSSREILEQVLEDGGYKVAAFQNGKVALESLERVAPCLIVTDLEMPTVDGLELCRRVRSHPSFRGIPIVFVSATDELRHKLRSFDVGGNDYLDKPLDEKLLLERVRRLLDLRSTQATMERVRGGG